MWCRGGPFRPGIRSWLSTAAFAAVLFGATAPSASGAEEVGNRCAANDAVADSTLIGDASNASPPPHPQIPQGDLWTITGWRVEVGPGLAPFAQQLAVFHFEGSQSYRKVAESTLETVVPGTNQFQTRIPAMEHDHVGLHGPEKTLVCRNDPLHLAGLVEGAFPLQSTRSYEALGETGVPVVAIVEPDYDLDYFGDETQDACPWTAAYQADCPAKLAIVSTAVRRRSVLVEVVAGMRASVRVAGRVGWKGGVPLRPAPEKLVSAGREATFKLPLPSSVQQRLTSLPSQRSLRARVTVRSTDFLNGIVERRLRFRLPGRGR